MRSTFYGAAIALMLFALAALTGCAHRPPEPAVTAGCFSIAVASAVGGAISAAVRDHVLPDVHIDASACGDLRAVPVDGLARAAITTAISLARLGAEQVEDPCVASTLAAAASWADRVVVALVEALSSGRVVVDVPGESVVCP